MPGKWTSEQVRRRASLIIVLIVACGVLAACGSEKKEATPSSATKASSPTETVEVPPTALTGEPRIGEVVWTSAIEPGTNAPVGAATPVVDDTTIYAVFPIESLPAGSQLVATWFFNNTSLDALSSAMRIDQDRVSGWIEFHIERTGADPWPNGTYEIVVTDGTTVLQRAEVKIS